MPIQRDVLNAFQECLREYPVVTLVGARQVGKTTLCQMACANKPYCSLENLDIRDFAENDPRGFLQQYPNGAILDEVQRVPGLLSYLQGLVDQRNEMGLFVLTGSHQPRLQEAISQSLAGRTAVLELGGFTLQEAVNYKPNFQSWDFAIHGSYPGIYAKERSLTRYMDSYVQTYVERDVRQLIQLKDLRIFQQFLALLAGRVGQVVNYSSLSNELGVSSVTVKNWVGVLEASFLVFTVKPWHANISKRLTKSPKVYFCDTGLLCHLLGIRTSNQLKRDPLRGNIYENFVVSEIRRQIQAKGQRSDLYFFREEHGHEVDLLIPEGRIWHPLEIKSAATFHKDFLKGIQYFQKLTKEQSGPGRVYYDGTEELTVHGIEVRNICSRLKPNQPI